MFKEVVKDIKVGDKVLSSDIDVLFKNKVKPEWWIVESISSCASSFRVRSVTDGEKAILYRDEIVMKVEK